MTLNTQRPYSVGELTREIKLMLEGSYPEVLLEGEISNFKPASSGHWYFTLKDSEAMIQAVMFRGSQRSVNVRPKDGQLVRIKGNISVYAPRGNYQIICSHLEAAGEGRILQMLEERKLRLADEGIFDSVGKKNLPLFPRTVAVLSSETGAAIRDIIQVLGRRASWLRVIVINIPVQGGGAGDQIARMVRMVDQHKLAEVIILGRGGGSLEDLLAFSDEVVVRSIAECSTPLISAVGHEIDWALSDFAADVRAPTPSAAAEMLCANGEELRGRILTAGRGIIHSFYDKVQRLRTAIHPFRVEILEESFKKLLQPQQMCLDDARQRLYEVAKLMLERSRQRLKTTLQSLEACSPYEILQRGYSIVRGMNNRVISQRKELEPGKKMIIQFHDGDIFAIAGENTDGLRDKEK